MAQCQSPSLVNLVYNMGFVCIWLFVQHSTGWSIAWKKGRFIMCTYCGAWEVVLIENRICVNCHHRCDHTLAAGSWPSTWPGYAEHDSVRPWKFKHLIVNNPLCSNYIRATFLLYFFSCQIISHILHLPISIHNFTKTFQMFWLYYLSYNKLVIPKWVDLSPPPPPLSLPSSIDHKWQPLHYANIDCLSMSTRSNNHPIVLNWINI